MSVVTVEFTAGNLYHNNFYRSLLSNGHVIYKSPSDGSVHTVFDIDYFDDKNYIIVLCESDDSFIINPDAKMIIQY